MLVKSNQLTKHITDLEETFNMLRKHQMNLNPTKCVFGVSSVKFLGFLVSHRGIEANPEKVKAVLEMQPPRTTKQLQQLTERIVTLNRFISRSTDKCLPFFKILRKAFMWSEECEEAFAKLKEYLMNPPLLSRPSEGEISSDRKAGFCPRCLSSKIKALFPSSCDPCTFRVPFERNLAEARSLGAVS